MSAGWRRLNPNSNFFDLVNIILLEIDWDPQRAVFVRTFALRETNFGSF